MKKSMVIIILVTSITVTIGLLKKSWVQAATPTQKTKEATEKKKADLFSKKLQETRARAIVQRVEATINVINRYLDRIVRSAPGVSTVQQKIKKNNDEIDKIKEKYGIKKLEKQLKKLEEDMNELYANVYTETSRQYSDLNKLVKQALDDATVASYAKQIRSLKTKMATELKDYLVKIQEKGKEINNLTKKTSQAELNKARIKTSLYKQQIETRMLSEKTIEEMDKYVTENREYNRDIQVNLAKLSSSDQVKIRELKSAIERLNFMLNALKNPSRIETKTVEDIIEIIT
ncbi:hypothetical protein KC460_02220 [Candidatus Dependentiae bacterium]|nr:hypothetical protein [Candidatus Dependentiae bacterium]